MAEDDQSAFVDAEAEPDPELNRMTNAIIGAAIEVHRRLGPGHLENVYREALAIEFEVRGIPFSKEHPIELTYRNRPIGKGRLDFLCFGQVIVELKAVEQISPVHKAQVISYVKITGHRLALLINFNVQALRQGIKRFAGPPRPW